MTSGNGTGGEAVADWQASVASPGSEGPGSVSPGSASPDGSGTAEPLMVAPDPAGDLTGWTLGKFADESDISIDDPELISPDGRPVLTWREDYPYSERMSRDEYDEV